MRKSTGDHLRRFATSRRQFLRASAVAGGLAAAGVVTPSVVTGVSLATAAAQEGDDLAVLQFALAIEHLQQALYAGLVDAGVFTGLELDYARTFTEHEGEHIERLSDAVRELGEEPAAAQPQYNFPEVRNREAALDLLSEVEDVGVSAYLGAASVIGDPALLTTAVTIHNVEAYHTAGVQAVAGKRSIGRATGRSLTQRQTGKLIGGYLYGGTPRTGGGATAEQAGDGVRLAAVAGLGAAALAGAGLARERGAAE